MTEYFSSIGPAVANHLWQSTVIAVAVWLVTLLLRRNPARMRFSLWLAASVKFLLPFSLLVGLGGMLPHPQRMVTASTAVYSAMDAVGLPFSDSNVLAPSLLEHTIGLRERAAAVLPMMLAAMWLCGVVGVLLMWFARWRRVLAILRKAVRVDEGREVEILRRMGGGIPLCLSQDLMEPGIFGVFRPMLLWPERLSEKLEGEHIEAIVAHELEHVRRRDNLTAMLHMSVEAVFWFHPMVWWMERRMVEERERACDEAVVEMGGNAEAYAESLLKACRFCVESPMVCVSGITGADLKMRIQGIMRLRLERLGFGRKALLAVAGIVAVAGPVLFGVMHAPMVRAQIEDAKVPKFDVVSIRPCDDPRQRQVPGDMYPPSGNSSPGRLRTGCYPLLDDHGMGLIRGAYADTFTPIHGGPSWIHSAFYEIDALAEGNPSVKMMMGPMMQALLEDRFHLKIRRQAGEGPIYILSVAHGGPKLHPFIEGSCTPYSTFPPPALPPGQRYCEILIGSLSPASVNDQGVTLDYFSRQLLGVLDRPVINKTGITGRFDIHVEFSREGTKMAAMSLMQPIDGLSPASDPTGPPSIFTALQEKLGLRLEPAKGPVEMLVIDRVERPTGEAGGEAPQATDMPEQAPATVSASNAPKLSFAVATVKPSSKDIVGMPSESAESFLAKGMSIENLIAYAYDLPWAQGLSNDPHYFWPRPPNLLGGPAWVREDTFDIAAKADDATVQAWNKLPPDQRKEQLRWMLRSLLEDRFKLTMRKETRVVPVYALVIAKGGAKVTPATAPPVPADPKVWTQPWKVDKGLLGGSAVTMSALAEMLRMNRELDSRKVIDQTGLTGKYDFTLKWSPQEDSTTDGSASSGPSLFTAIQEQLGLKLESTKASAEVLVIDHIERPTAN